MKILIIGNNYSWSLETYFMNLLNDITDVNASIFPAQRFFLIYYSKGVQRKIFFKLGLSRIYSKINRRLMSVLLKDKPDVVLVFKGMEINIETLSFIREQGVLLVNYNPDNPFIFSGRGSGNNNLRKSLFYYDFHLTYSQEIMNQFTQMSIKSFLLPFAFHKQKSHLNMAEKSAEIMKICFVGNADIHRVKTINILASMGVEIDVYGSGWDAFKMNESIYLGPFLWGDAFFEKLNKYRAQLNLMRVHNMNSHNMRTFEIPGNLGIQIAPKTIEHTNFFQDGENIFLFNDTDECVEKINYILSLPFEKATEIREKSYCHVKDLHTYSYRISELYNILKSELEIFTKMKAFSV
jgi:spore maturation protein CgeB